MLYPVELRAQLAKHTPRSLANIGLFVDKTILNYSEKSFEYDRSEHISSVLIVENSVRFLTQCHVFYKVYCQVFHKKTRSAIRSGSYMITL